MFISQTGLTYFYKWQCEIQILSLIKCGSCNRCDQRLFLLASCFFRLAESLWNHGIFSVVPAFQTVKYYFYKVLVQILNLIKCGSSNRCDQRLFLLASCFFCLAESLWNHGIFSVVPAFQTVKYYFCAGNFSL